MSAPGTRVSGEWLALREPADAAARAPDLVAALARALTGTGSLLIHDLGSGTGSMGRWLAPRLPGPQHWVLHDRDPDLLARAAADGPGAALDGTMVSVECRSSDITRLGRADLAGASVITASALLDVLTEDEAAGLVALCADARCPVLLALSVLGHVSLTPEDPLDRRVAAAFDAHQRRPARRGRLLGPDAVPRVVQAFERRAAKVLVRPSPWRLGAPEAELTAQWFTGWVGAACEQQAELSGPAGPYTRRRLAQARAGELAVTVDHADLLVIPP